MFIGTLSPKTETRRHIVGAPATMKRRLHQFAVRQAIEKMTRDLALTGD
jgi:hypothetical protein